MKTRCPVIFDRIKSLRGFLNQWKSPFQDNKYLISNEIFLHTSHEFRLRYKLQLDRKVMFVRLNNTGSSFRLSLVDRSLLSNP